MMLSDEQCMRFFDTMDALLYYVNARFRVVEGFTLDSAGAIDDMKASIVARTLWENVEIIDEFVRENPARLSQSCLVLAASWKDALPGFYTVVRYQGGRALLMNDTGVFSVGGVSTEIEAEIGPAPAYVEVVLIPFEDSIVYDGFLQAYSPGGTADELQRIQDEFEERCAKGIVSSAEEFHRVAADFLAARRDKELEALLADVSREAEGAAEVLPAGFHRGALAGLSHEERIAARMKALPDLGTHARALAQEVREARRDQAAVRAEMVVNCAVACALWRGVVEIPEAYEQYRALVPDALGPDEFERLVRDEAEYPDAYFSIWTCEGRDYLAYCTLTPDFVAQQMLREGNWDDLPSELQYYEDYKRGLLDVRSEVAPRPLSRTLLENNAVSEVLGHASVLRLRDFLDERVPDGADDYLFADFMAEDVALISIETGSLDQVFSYLHENGVDGCTANEERFVTLVTNVYNAMPSWENNGWSPQELYEQLTGRKMFYNEDGSVMRVGADEPCPCGSGRTYRECCGR